MSKRDRVVCSTAECGSPATIKDCCRRCYMRRYNREYYLRNRDELLAQRKFNAAMQTG